GLGRRPVPAAAARGPESELAAGAQAVGVTPAIVVDLNVERKAGISMRGDLSLPPFGAAHSGEVLVRKLEAEDRFAWQARAPGELRVARDDLAERRALDEKVVE